MKYYVSGIPACVSSFPTQIKVLRCWKACAYLLSLWEYPSLFGACWGIFVFLKVLMSYVTWPSPLPSVFLEKREEGPSPGQQKWGCVQTTFLH